LVKEETMIPSTLFTELKIHQAVLEETVERTAVVVGPSSTASGRATNS
jgi:hypothetical protein